MIWYKAGLWFIIFVFFIEGCSGPRQSSDTWDATERSSLGGSQNDNKFMDKLISVQLHPANAKDGYFDLYYYILQPSEVGTVEKKTVLFVAGGPGQITRFNIGSVPPLPQYLFHHGYQVVFFHLRGSGFSQIPPSNKFDQFLRTRYAVEDIEAIRRDLQRQKLLAPNGKWDAIIGYSYGTILAQEYTSKYDKNVEKLVLIGPESRHMFIHPRKSYKDELDELNRKEREIQRESLKRILEELAEFNEPNSQSEKDTLLDRIFGVGEDVIFNKTLELFGNIQFVIENYCDLQNDLQKNKLHYSRAFFQNVRALRHLGSVPRSDETRMTIGRAIVSELRQGPQNDKACSQVVEEQENHRNFFVMTAYDGINSRFLKEWLSSDKKDFRDALRRSAGTAGVIPYVGKVGIADDVSQIKAWDPGDRDHVHSVPTIILKGGGDPVSAGGAGEEFFNRGLTGPRTFIKFPGVGHQFELPAADELKWDGIVTLHLPNIPRNEIVPAVGSLIGAKIDPRFKLALEPFEKTRHRDSLILLGFGVLKEELILDKLKARENIVALFKNAGSRDLDGSTDWIIKSGEFTAIVRFVLKVPLQRQKTAIAVGTIIGGRRLSEAHVKVESGNESHGRNPDLIVPCVRILRDNAVEVWFYHNGHSGSKPILPTEGRQFTITNGDETRIIEHKVGQSLKPGQVAVEKFTVKGLTTGVPDHRVELKDRTGSDTVSACVPREETIGSTLTMMLWNSNDQGNWKSGENRTWLVTNDIFTAYINVEKAVDIPPNGMRGVTGTVHGVRVNSPLKLLLPEARNGKIDWLAINVLGKNQVSVLIENRAAPVVEGPEDWTYTSKRGACNNPGNSEGLLHCLLYIFIDMDTAKFQNGGISKLLVDIIRKTFLKKEKFPENDLKIQHCSGPSDAPERCVISSM